MNNAARKPVEEPLAPLLDDDPVWTALMRAPVGPPDTEDERRVIEEARARGEWVPGSVVSAEVSERCRRGG